jgi:NAD(P)-dependent dehydrogenase (short-subunit alcohol dehydrogenase family)
VLTRPRPILDGLVTLITGAASGIGRATAEAFDGSGAKTVLVDIDEAMLGTLAASLSDRARPYVADLAVPEQVDALLADVERVEGTIDVLVNNAGISSKTAFLDVDEAEWDNVFAINVEAALQLALRVAPRMAERRSGSIVNVSSISGRGGGPPQSVYGVTKGALLGFTNEMARALAPHSVRVNAVLPGVIDTPMVQRDTARAGDQQGAELAAWIEDEVPAGRIGKPREVANVLVFLASSDGAGVTGALFPVDGGFLAK